MDSRYQLPHRIRLGEVIVGPKLQSRDDTGLTVLGADDDDGRGRRFADLAKHVEVRHPGKHEIEENDVGWVFAEPDKALRTIGNGVDLKTLPSQSDFECFLV